MLKHLESISSSVYERYLTLEKNIKSKSNSFYDAYLDLQESLVRHIISDVGLEINARLSCGELLRLEQVQSLFLDALGVDSHSYEKMKDYSRKVNSHKHSKEKNIELDTILSYVAIIYDVSACFAKYRLIPVSPLDFSYFREIYNLYERENCQLKRQLGEYRELIEQSDLEREEKERYRLLFTYSELDNKSLEEQNGELRARIEELKSFKERTLEKIDSIDERLKRVEKDISDNASGINQDEFVKREAVQRFVKHSEKFFKWLGNGEEHLRKKCVIAGMFFGFFISMLLANITVTISLGYYGTYSFVQNIWCILAICMLVYTVRARELYSFNTYSRNTIELFTLDKSFIPHKTGKKKKYVVLLALSVLSSLADIYLAISEGWSLAVIVIICELALSAFSVVYYIMALRFFDDYWAVYIIGNTVNGEELSLVLDPLTNRIVDRKFFEEKYKIN